MTQNPKPYTLKEPIKVTPNPKPGQGTTMETTNIGCWPLTVQGLTSGTVCRDSPVAEGPPCFSEDNPESPCTQIVYTLALK